MVFVVFVCCKLSSCVRNIIDTHILKRVLNKLPRFLPSSSHLFCLVFSMYLILLKVPPALGYKILYSCVTEVNVSVVHTIYIIILPSKMTTHSKHRNPYLEPRYFVGMINTNKSRFVTAEYTLVIFFNLIISTHYSTPS